MKAVLVVVALLGLLGGSQLVASSADAVITTPGTAIAVGASPVGVTVNPAGTRAYVTINSSNQVAVIDRATGNLLTPLTAGNEPMGIVFLPDGSKAYVANRTGGPGGVSGTVSVIDPATGSTLSTIPVGKAPFFIAMSPDGSTAYVTNSGANAQSVSVIRTSDDTVTATITAGLAPLPVAVAFSKDGKTAYVAHGNALAATSLVSVIDVDTSTVIKQIPVPGTPYGIAVSPDGFSVYVSRISANKVSIIDTATNTLNTTTEFIVGNKPEGVTFSPDGARVYIPTKAGSVSVIDAVTRTLLPSIPSGAGSRKMAFTPDGTVGYVTNNLGGTVSVYAFDSALPTITGTPGAATVGTPYSFTPTVTGTAVTVTLFAGPLPPGLSLASGVISGTPTTAGSYPITLQATNANGFAALSTTIVAALPTYTVSFDPAGGLPDPADQTVTQGQHATAPATPTRAAYAFDGWWNGGTRWNFGNTVTTNVALTAHWLVLPTITGAAAVDAPVDAAFTWTPTLTAVAGYTVSATGLPSGLSISPTTGVISGAPVGPLAPSSVVVTVTDSNGASTFTVTITVVHGAASSVTVTASDLTPQQGDTIALTVLARDARGNSWDATGTAAFTSSVGTDTFASNRVTFPHASPHRLTATVGAASGNVLVQVSAASRLLGFTGGGGALWLLLPAMALIAIGARLRLRGRSAA